VTRSPRAFISYRRNDSYIRGPDPNRPTFITQLAAALRQLGCSEVFVDTSEIQAGDYFEDRIHKAISNSDLFIPLIGRDWLRLLDERRTEGAPDILARELEAAFTLEKDIVPLRIDGARMPRADELPIAIRELANVDGEAVASGASVETIAATLATAVREASRVRRLGRRWAASYALFGLFVWLMAAVVPNAVGLAEFGHKAWAGMAVAWAGMFIWPLFFMPFVILALYRPLQILLEAALNAESLVDSLKYASPLILGTVIAAGVTVVEISPPQVPWTVHPQLLRECKPPSAPATAPTQYDRDRHMLASYGAAGAIPERYGSQFWMRDKCWPNVFFYLTLPLKGPGGGSIYDAAERDAVQQAFLRILAKDSADLKGTEASYSALFPFYALAFFLIDAHFAAALLMAMIYTTISIRRPRDGKILRVPNEDAFLCLMYGFITVLIWIPFRLTTNSVKFSYYCTDVGDCEPILETFMKDVPFGLTILAAYVAVTVGILWNHKRLLLGSLGTIVVCLIVAGTWAVYAYYPTISRLTDYWQFWLAVSLLASLMLTALWYQFDPAIVRFKDFQRGGRRVRER
jgi:TIR domain